MKIKNKSMLNNKMINKMDKIIKNNSTEMKIMMNKLKQIIRNLKNYYRIKNS